MSATKPPLVETRGLLSGSGQVPVLHGVDIDIAPGSITALIGANGAGKTTLMRTLAGLIPARAGSVRFEGREIVDIPTHRRVDGGIGLVPEGRLVFALPTVEQNLGLVRVPPRARARIEGWVETVFGQVPRVRARGRQPAGSMSGRR